MESVKKPVVALTSILLLSAALVVGCGGDSKPAYCDRVDELRDSVTALTDISIDANLLSTVETDLETVRTNAEQVVDAAREDFPQETDDLETAVNNASDSIQELPSSPSAGEIAALAIEIGSVGSSASSLIDATTSSCV